MLVGVSLLAIWGGVLPADGRTDSHAIFSQGWFLSAPVSLFRISSSPILLLYYKSPLGSLDTKLTPEFTIIFVCLCSSWFYSSSSESSLIYLCVCYNPIFETAFPLCRVWGMSWFFKRKKTGTILISYSLFCYCGFLNSIGVRLLFYI